jgi:hypothetical protein
MRLKTFNPTIILGEEFHRGVVFAMITECVFDVPAGNRRDLLLFERGIGICILLGILDDRVDKVANRDFVDFQHVIFVLDRAAGVLEEGEQDWAGDERGGVTVGGLVEESKDVSDVEAKGLGREVNVVARVVVVHLMKLVSTRRGMGM